MGKLCVNFFFNCFVIFIDDVFKLQYVSECIDWKLNKISCICLVYVLFNVYGFIFYQLIMKFNYFLKILNLIFFEIIIFLNIMYIDRFIEVGNSF